jgi:hypothetical protein
MAVTKYNHVKLVNPITLEDEIRQNLVILKGINNIISTPTEVDIYFKEALSTAEETELTSLVTAHVYTDPNEGEVLTVNVQEELPGAETNGRFRSRSLEADCTGTLNTWTSVEVSFPINISFLSAEYNMTEDHVGDYVRVDIVPNDPAVPALKGIVGAITADAAVNDTVINVSDDVLANMQIGFYVQIGTDLCGQCIAIDFVAKTITVETAIQNAQAAATPSYVKIRVRVLDDIKLLVPGPYAIGENKIGGSFLKAGYIMDIQYKKVKDVTKVFGATMDYLY